MLGRNRHRIAETEPIGFADAGQGGTSLGLVGDKDDRLAAAPQPAGKMAIGFGDAGARIDDEERHIGFGERLFGLHLHAPGKRGRRRLGEPGGIDRPKFEIGDPGGTFAAVAGQPRRVVDQSQPAADEPVE